MPAISALTLSDREATPTDRTFVPSYREGSLFYFRETDNDLLAASPVLTVNVNKGTERYVTTLKLTVPVKETETVNGVDHTIVHGESIVNIRFNIDPHTTRPDRRVLRGLIISALEHAKIEGVLDDVEGFY